MYRVFIKSRWSLKRKVNIKLTFIEHADYSLVILNKWILADCYMYVYSIIITYNVGIFMMYCSEFHSLVLNLCFYFSNSQFLMKFLK